MDEMYKTRILNVVFVLIHIYYYNNRLMTNFGCMRWDTVDKHLFDWCYYELAIELNMP